MSFESDPFRFADLGFADEFLSSDDETFASSQPVLVDESGGDDALFVPPSDVVASSPSADSGIVLGSDTGLVGCFAGGSSLVSLGPIDPSLQSWPRTPFLKGPVPMRWLYAAYHASPSALAVGVYLFHVAGMVKDGGPIRLNISRLASNLDCHRSTVSRALKALEMHGLVSVVRGRGCCSLVRLPPYS